MVSNSNYAILCSFFHFFPFILNPDSNLGSILETESTIKKSSIRISKSTKLRMRNTDWYLYLIHFIFRP